LNSSLAQSAGELWPQILGPLKWLPWAGEEHIGIQAM